MPQPHPPRISGHNYCPPFLNQITISKTPGRNRTCLSGRWDTNPTGAHSLTNRTQSFNHLNSGASVRPRPCSGILPRHPYGTAPPCTATQCPRQVSSLQADRLATPTFRLHQSGHSVCHLRHGGIKDWRAFGGTIQSPPVQLETRAFERFADWPQRGFPCWTRLPRRRQSYLSSFKEHVTTTQPTQSFNRH